MGDSSCNTYSPAYLNTFWVSCLIHGPGHIFVLLAEPIICLSMVGLDPTTFRSLDCCSTNAICVHGHVHVHVDWSLVESINHPVSDEVQFNHHVSVLAWSCWYLSCFRIITNPTGILVCDTHTTHVYIICQIEWVDNPIQIQSI